MTAESEEGMIMDVHVRLNMCMWDLVGQETLACAHSKCHKDRCSKPLNTPHGLAAVAAAGPTFLGG
jgi:hypothetical protein